MRNHSNHSVLTIACAAVVALALSGCEGMKQGRNARRTQVESEALGSLESTRKALEGSWTLVSLEVVNPQGARTPVTASGQLTYDAYGTMTVRGVVDDPKVRDTIVLDYTGRIVIDTTRLEFRPMDLTTDRPVEPSQIVPISPDKVRKYQLAGDSFVVTYLDASSTPTAIASWRRAK